MTDPNLSTLLLQEEGYCILEQAEEGALRLIGVPPSWFHEVFGEIEGPGGTARLTEKSPFLENFLVDAAASWESASPGRVHSGEWIERGASGREIPLEASALCLEGRNILIITNPQRQFRERSGTLQTAREFTLEHERLQKEITKKEILLHCIIHDLSQPLTAIRGCLGLLSLEGMPKSAQSVLEIALRQSRRQEEMIRGILDAFSGELAMRHADDREAVSGPDLAQCAREIVADYTPAFAEHGVRIELDAAVDLAREWRIYGDAARLRRIFTNLVENALRYSPAGSTVTLGMIKEGQFLRATVDDQGPGLPQGDSAPQLFSLFGKGKESGGKAGLGLYFCKMTVERWGGEIGAERRREGGTRFWFRLPVWKHSTPEQPAAASGKPAKELHSAADRGRLKANHARPLRILLAEDLDVNLEMTTKLLKRKGHTVVAARNGRQAISSFARNSFDVILMDVEMPVMDGIAATRAIREKEKIAGGHTRIVGITGHTTEADRQRLLAAGMDACLAKPFEMEALWQILSSADSSPAEPSSAKPAPPAKTQAPKGFEEALLARVGGDRKLLASLIRLFQAECPGKLKAARKAVVARDARALAGAAHAVKGLVGNFGAQPTLVAARELEAMGWNGDLTGAEIAFATLEKEVFTLRTALAGLGAKLAAKRPRTISRRKR